MGDEGGMDPCECFWGHELAMRRLLNVIRNSQATCTDNECFEDGFRSQTPLDPNVLMMTVFFVAALFLFYFRPRPQRIKDDPTKPNNDFNGAPPSPPSPLF